MSSTIRCLPIYQEFFSSNIQEPSKLPWEWLNSTSLEDKDIPASIDFSISKPAAGWDELAKKIAMIVLKVILFPWGIYELTKYFVQRIAMIPLYPAQSNLVKNHIAPELSVERLNKERAATAKYLRQNGYIVRHVALEKDGTVYSGLLIGHKTTIHNGNWALQATGNAEPIEYSAENFAKAYCRLNFNTLLINGPGAGQSKGEANPKTMGEAQEIGMSFLETALKAKKMILGGRSLGGAALGRGVMQHDFKTDVSYLVVRQMTFDSVSNITKKLLSDRIAPWIGRLAKNLIKWSGCEMDSVEVSRHLQKLGIKEIIVQSTTRHVEAGEIPVKENFRSDGVIPGKASLGYRLIKEKITENKVFCCIEKGRHMQFNPEVLRPHVKAM
jgi:hypothetical protein